MKILTCDSCGEEYEVTPEQAAEARVSGHFVCPMCDAEDGSARSHFTNHFFEE